MEEIHDSPGTEPQQVASPPPLITTAAALIIALNTAEPGSTIQLKKIPNTRSTNLCSSATV